MMNRKLVAWLLVTIMILAVFAVAAQPAAGATASRKTMLTINAPTNAYKLQTFAVSGKLIDGTGTGINDMTVTVYRSTDGKKWSMLATCLTSGGGYYSLPTSEPAGKYYYKASFAGSKVYASASSGKVSVAVDSLIATALTLEADPNTVFDTDYFSLKGQITGNGVGISGQVVHIQVYNPGTHIWQAVADLTSDAYGLYHFNALPDPGYSTTLQFRAVFEGTVDYTSATSGVCNLEVKVKPPTATTLTLNTDLYEALPNQPITFSGILKDADNIGIWNIQIDIQKYNSQTGGWDYLNSVTTDGAGVYTVTFTEPTAGTYNYRAVTHYIEKYAMATSSVCTVSVLPMTLEVDAAWEDQGVPYSDTVSARQTDTLGNAEGSFEMTFSLSGHVRGEVIALSVEGDSAWIGVVITDSSYVSGDYAVGHLLVIMYTDASPNTVSLRDNSHEETTPSELLAYVNSHPALTLVPVYSGSVVIS